MKKFTKVLACLTGAAIICSAGALSACGSVTSGGETGDNNSTYNGETESEGDTTTGGNTDDSTTDDGTKNLISDEVTAEEWEAAFADENFYNVTINSTRNYSYFDSYIVYYSENDDDYSSESQSRVGGGNYTYKYDLTSADDVLLGNIYTYEDIKYENQHKYQYEEYTEHNVDTDESGEAIEFHYYQYNEQGYKIANKFVDDGVEYDWGYNSRSYPLYVEQFGFNINGYENEYLLTYAVDLACNQEFEYKDGAYVYSFTHDYSEYIDEDWKAMAGIEIEVTEFVGGTETYSVIIKEGKVYSIIYTYTYTLGYNIGAPEYAYNNIKYDSYSQTYEWTFSDYGTTTVTVPDEVSALFE